MFRFFSLLFIIKRNNSVDIFISSGKLEELHINKILAGGINLNNMKVSNLLKHKEIIRHI